MTKKIKSIVYGIGGFDESKPDNNLIEIVYYTKDELAELEAAEAKETARVAFAPSEEKLEVVSSSRMTPSVKFKSA